MRKLSSPGLFFGFTLSLALPCIGLTPFASGCGDSGGSGGNSSGGSSSGGAKSTGTGGSGGAAADKKLVVLFTSDEHSHIFSFSPELDDYPTATSAGDGSLKGGIARRKAVIDKERKAASDAGIDSILVSAGDNQMGGLSHLAFQSKSIDYGVMKVLGYDVTTFGNHEFDFGPQALANSIKAAGSSSGLGLPPIVASNIHFSSSDKFDDDLAALYSTKANDDQPVHSYRVITTKGGVKVGIIGYVGVNAAHVAPNKTPVVFSVPAGAKNDGDLKAGLPLLYKDLQPVVDALRNTEKVDVVVAIAHAGILDSSTDAGVDAGEDPGVCDNVQGIDLIVSGHAHDHNPKPFQRTNKTDKKPCLVLSGGAFGEELGRIQLTIPGDPSKNVSWDPSTQALIPIDSSTVPDAAVAGMLDELVESIESAGSGSSILAGLLTHALGSTVTNDTKTSGDLFFHPISTTTFDVTDTKALIDLSADSMLAASDAWAAETGGPMTDMAIESAGVIRQAMKKGKTGVIGTSDAFDVVPLGASPADGTVGYPLIRGTVNAFSLRGVVEFGLALGPENSDYNLGYAGLEVQYDASRPVASTKADLFDASKGQVIKLTLASSHADGFETFDKVIYDRNASDNDSTLPVTVVSSSYIGQFASDAGVTLAGMDGNPVSLVDAIIHRKDGSEIKQVEGFLSYLHAAPGGALAPLYNKASSSFTKRVVCIKGC